MLLGKEEILDYDDYQAIFKKGMSEFTIMDIVARTLATANLAMDQAGVPYRLQHIESHDDKTLSVALYKR